MSRVVERRSKSTTVTQAACPFAATPEPLRTELKPASAPSPSRQRLTTTCRTRPQKRLHNRVTLFYANSKQHKATHPFPGTASCSTWPTKTRQRRRSTYWSPKLPTRQDRRFSREIDQGRCDGLDHKTHRDGLLCWHVLSTRTMAAIDKSRGTQDCSDSRLE